MTRLLDETLLDGLWCIMLAVRRIFTKTIKEISFDITRNESGFDKACDSAKEYALVMLGANEDGYLEKIDDWCRSTDFIDISFVSLSMLGGMAGWDYIYSFVCKVCRNE